jgi:hypothetical protein
MLNGKTDLTATFVVGLVFLIIGAAYGVNKPLERAEQAEPRIVRCFVGGPIDDSTSSRGMVLYEADVVERELKPICTLHDISVQAVAEDPSTDTLVMVGFRIYPGYHRSCVIIRRGGSAEERQEFLLEKPYGMHRDRSVTYAEEDGKFYIAIANSLFEDGTWLDEGLVYEYDPRNGELLELARLDYSITLVGARPGDKLYVVYPKPGGSSPRKRFFGYFDKKELKIYPSDFKPPDGWWDSGTALYPTDVESVGPIYYFERRKRGPSDYFKVAYVSDPRNPGYYREFRIEINSRQILYSSKYDVLFFLSHTGDNRENLVARNLSDGSEYSFELPSSGPWYSYTLIGAE